MRIVVDALAADFGGIRTYVENLLGAWERHRPEDELLVVVRAGSPLLTGDHRRHELTIPRPTMLGRPVVQGLRSRRICRDFAADVALVTMPATSPLGMGVPMAVVVHDLRHELRPEQFSRGRRVLRGISYSRGYALASAIISVSQRSLDDLHRLHPRLRRTPAVVAHHGADHALAWPGVPGTGSAVSFAHHTNKNPDLVLDAWADGIARGLDLPDLVVLGTGGQRAALTARTEQLGISDRVRLAPFLPEDEFAEVMGSASMVVFPSDFEGFGLPVVEGMLRGVPVVIGPETATLEVAGGLATVMTDWTPSALANAVAEAASVGPAQREQARRHAETFTWQRCVEDTRAGLLAACGQQSGTRV